MRTFFRSLALSLVILAGGVLVAWADDDDIGVQYRLGRLATDERAVLEPHADERTLVVDGADVYLVLARQHFPVR